jgi:hypothetical protein
MRPLERWTLQFWSAAYFYRRALDRDRKKAVLALVDVAENSTGTVFDRAISLLKEINENGQRPRS